MTADVDALNLLRRAYIGKCLVHDPCSTSSLYIHLATGEGIYKKAKKIARLVVFISRCNFIVGFLGVLTGQLRAFDRHLNLVTHLKIWLIGQYLRKYYTPSFLFHFFIIHLVD
jgi:hypothetical protein